MPANPYYDDSDSDNTTPPELTPDGNTGMPEWATIASDLTPDPTTAPPMPTSATPPVVPEGYAPVAPQRPGPARPTTPTAVPMPPVTEPVPTPQPTPPASKPVNPARPTQPAQPVREPQPTRTAPETPAATTRPAPAPKPAPTPRIVPQERTPEPEPYTAHDDDEDVVFPSRDTKANRRRQHTETNTNPEAADQTNHGHADAAQGRTSRLRRQPKPNTGSGSEAGNNSKRKFGFGKKPNAGTATTEKLSNRGGRKHILIFRVIVYVVFAILIGIGLKNTLFPPQIDEAAIVNTVAGALGETGFPLQTGQALAEEFTTAYLTYPEDENSRDLRNARLAATVVGATLEDLNFADLTSQTVLAGPYISRAPGLLDANRTTYYLAALITTTPVQDGTTDPDTGTLIPPTPSDPYWVYLAVPVISNTGGLAIGGMPAFVAAPDRATVPEPFAMTIDTEASKSLAVDLPGFLTAWAASNNSNLARYLPDDATATARNGMSGRVKFIQADNVIVSTPDPNNPGAPLLASATVRWAFGPGVQVDQGYRLYVYAGTDGRWYVQDIRGATYGVEQITPE